MPDPRRALACLPLAVVLALAGCGDGREDVAGETRPQATTTAGTETTEQASAAGCRAVDEPRPREEPDLKRPTQRLDPSKRWTAVMKTTCGTMEIRLAVDRAPKTASSFAALARRDFYAGLPFHRVVEGFVIQGGDPTGTGNGGPGYQVVEEPPSDLRYTRGTVAMAKTELEEPGTSGSQFFIVTSEEPAPLPPEYALVGKVVKGLDVLERIGSVPTDPGTEQPVDPVVIEDVTIRQGAPGGQAEPQGQTQPQG